MGRRKEPLVKACEMANCPRRVPEYAHYCANCKQWWRYWQKKDLVSFKLYNGKLRLAASRVSEREDVAAIVKAAKARTRS